MDTIRESRARRLDPRNRNGDVPAELVGWSFAALSKKGGRPTYLGSKKVPVSRMAAALVVKSLSGHEPTTGQRRRIAYLGLGAAP